MVIGDGSVDGGKFVVMTISSVGESFLEKERERGIIFTVSIMFIKVKI